MYRKVNMLLLLFVMVQFTNVYAQDAPKHFAADRIQKSKEVSFQKDLVFSLGVSGDLPQGDWKKYASFGFGPEIGIWYHIDDHWTITGRGVYSWWQGKSYVNSADPRARYDNQQQLLLNPGIRYNFNKTFWVNPEAGYRYNRFGSIKESGANGGLTIGADIYGPETVMGLGLGYQVLNFNGISYNQIGIRFRVYIGLKREQYDITEE
ncbi:MAG: transporter [Chitinophagaceae bacterium]|uniref:hypothetical protein n=1 Tax=unclassified Paraflavitalea TaxID=2798305 RepID=UPI003D337BFC|nr:transporter [Chitinophagaceae bacterium]